MTQEQERSLDDNEPDTFLTLPVNQQAARAEQAMMAHATWEIDRTRKYYKRDVIRANGIIIAILPDNSAGCITPENTRADDRARAQILLAVPELVKSLQMLVATDTCNYERDTMRHVGLFEQARAALAKAGLRSSPPPIPSPLS